MSIQFQTAILFLVFNRLETVKLVFESIRKVKPPRLYIAADGPREKIIDDYEKVENVRKYIISCIDWNCEIKTLFRKKNLGCKYAVSSAINWFFEHEDMGIILEDDCLPSLSFFRYCEELLLRYKEDSTIAIISGRNNLGKYYPKHAKNYFFTSRGFIWGWATWRRVIKGFDTDFITDSNKKELLKKLKKNSSSNAEFRFRKKNIDDLISGTVNTWDYQFNIFQLLNKRRSIVPCLNMIKNVGFGGDATNTKENIEDKIEQYEIYFPLPEENITCNCFTKNTLVSGGIFLFSKKVIRKMRKYFYTR